LSQNEINTFHAIVNLLEDLNNHFSHGARCKSSVNAYYELLANTQTRHTKNIVRHINLFIQFINANETAIQSNGLEFVGNVVEFNKDFKLDMNVIVAECDPQARQVVYDHLLHIKDTFLGRVASRPEPQAMSVLDNIIPGLDSETKSLFQEIAGDISGHVDADAKDPLTAAMSLFKSDAFEGIVRKIATHVQSGNMSLDTIDIAKIFSSLGNARK